MSALTPQEAETLAHARHVETLPDDGSRHRYVREQLRLPYTTYLQRLNRLLDSPQALAAEPELVYRLRRIRDHRNAQRGHAR